jgi:hypothetical protein
MSLLEQHSAHHGECLAGVIASMFGRPILPNPPLFRGSTTTHLFEHESRTQA